MRARSMVWLVALTGVACTKTVKLNPELEAKFQRATDLVRSDDKNSFAEAERLLEEVTTAEPGFRDAVYWRATMLIAWSDTLLEEAVVLEASETELAELVERAKAKAEAAEAPEAKEFASMLVSSISERRDEVAATRTQWQADASQYKQRGLELVKAEIEGKPAASYKAHRILADYHRIRGETDKARQELAEVRKANPNSAGLHFLEGIMKLKVDKDYAGAVASMDQALSRDPGFVKALYYKGLALAEKGDKNAAEQVMKTVLEKSTDHLGAKTYLRITDAVQQATADLERDEAPASE